MSVGQVVVGHLDLGTTGGGWQRDQRGSGPRVAKFTAGTRMTGTQSTQSISQGRSGHFKIFCRCKNDWDIEQKFNLSRWFKPTMKIEIKSHHFHGKRSLR